MAEISMSRAEATGSPRSSLRVLAGRAASPRTGVSTDDPSGSTSTTALDTSHANGAAPCGATRGAPQRGGRRRATGVGVIVAFVIVDGLSLFGVHLLFNAVGPIKPPGLNTNDDAVVLVRLEKLDSIANRLTVKVLVIPREKMFDKRLDVLTTDTAVRVDPPNDLGDRSARHPLVTSSRGIDKRMRARRVTTL